jgi:hypothetical protein
MRVDPLSLLLGCTRFVPEGGQHKHLGLFEEKASGPSERHADF